MKSNYEALEPYSMRAWTSRLPHSCTGWWKNTKKEIVVTSSCLAFNFVLSWTIQPANLDEFWIRINNNDINSDEKAMINRKIDAITLPAWGACDNFGILTSVARTLFQTKICVS